MKIQHSDEWATVYQAACPSCDLPLDLVVPCRGPISWRHNELSHDDCPRCGHGLPAVDWDTVEREPVLRPVRPVDLAAVERLEAFAAGPGLRTVDGQVFYSAAWLDGGAA